MKKFPVHYKKSGISLQLLAQIVFLCYNGCGRGIKQKEDTQGGSFGEMC